MAGKEILGDVFRNDRFVFAERVEVTVAFFRGDFVADMEELAKVGIEELVPWVVA